MEERFVDRAGTEAPEFPVAGFSGFLQAKRRQRAALEKEGQNILCKCVSAGRAAGAETVVFFKASSVASESPVLVTKRVDVCPVNLMSFE